MDKMFCAKKSRKTTNGKINSKTTRKTENNQIIKAKQRRKVANKKIGEKPMMFETRSWGVQKCSMLSAAGRDWADLDPNLLEEILSRVPIHDLFNVSFVCLSWKNICCRILFWEHNVLDLSGIGVGFHPDPNSSALESLRLAESRRLPGLFGENQSEEQYNETSKTLSRLLQFALEGDTLQDWRFSISCIILPYDLEISDKQLLYIADRTPCVKRLILLNIRRMTLEGFSWAIGNWSHMKELHLGSLDCSEFDYFSRELGIFCEELEFLHLHQKGLLMELPFANYIVERLPKVKKVELDSFWVCASALRHLILNARSLKELCFTRCGLIRYSERCPFPPHDEFYDAARLIETFTLSWTLDSDAYTNWLLKLPSDASLAAGIKDWLWDYVGSILEARSRQVEIRMF